MRALLHNYTGRPVSAVVTEPLLTLAEELPNRRRPFTRPLKCLPTVAAQAEQIEGTKNAEEIRVSWTPTRSWIVGAKGAIHGSVGADNLIGYYFSPVRESRRPKLLATAFVSPQADK
jgi:hypothetical protein